MLLLDTHKRLLSMLPSEKYINAVHCVLSKTDFIAVISQIR